MKSISDGFVFSSIWGTDAGIVIGLSEGSLVTIDEAGKSFAVLSLHGGDETFSPVGDYSPLMDVFVAAVAPGMITAVQVSTGRVIWRVKDRRLITSICILDASSDVVVAGRSTKVLKLSDGTPTSSAITGCHSHLNSGNGCFCIRNKTQEKYWFSDASKPGLILDPVLPSLKLSLHTGHCFVAVGFDSPAEIYFLDPHFGKLVSRVVIPDSLLVDALSYDANEDALLIASHSVFSIIEVWRVHLDGRRELVSTLPRGIGGTSWSFHNHGRNLISRAGRMADTSSGELVRRSWEEWQLKEIFQT